MSALKRIERMQREYERSAASLQDPNEIKPLWILHTNMAEAYAHSARYVRESRSVMMSVAIFVSVLAGVAIGYFVEH
jgi:hypothetical protein